MQEAAGREGGQTIDRQETIIRQFGLLAPIDWGEDCEEELHRMTKLWNELVAIETANRAKYETIIAETPGLKVLRDEITRLTDAHQASVSERKDLKAKGGRKLATPELDQRIRTQYSELIQARQQAARSAKQFREHVRDSLQKLETDRRAAVKLARQESGLWWGNYNAIVKSFERGRSAALRAGGEMRLKSYDGSGRFTNQIQGGMSVKDLFSGAHSQVCVAPLPANAWSESSRGKRRRLQRTFLTVTAFTEDGERRTVTWPMIMHREIPADCWIKEVVVTRRKFALKWRWQVVFTCTQPAPLSTPHADGPTIAIKLGWRRVADGIKVATVLRSDSTTPSNIIMPADFVARFAHADELRSLREKDRCNALMRVHSIDWTDAPLALKEQMEALRKMTFVKSADLAALCKLWHDHKSWNPDAFDALRRWQSKDKKLLLWGENLRDKLIKRREDFYSKIVRDTVASARAIILNEFDIAEASRVTKRSGDENPLPIAARRYRTIAAPSRLRSWIEHHARKNGVEMFSASKAVARTCSICGTDNEPSQPAVMEFCCSRCGVRLDPDVNICQNMLKDVS
jgi:hypothetical protein